MKWFFTPVIGPMLQNRWFILILAGVGVVQLALTITGLTGWQCPIRSTFGVTCPGCGLTTAIAMLLKGNWHMAVQTHAFAPLLLIILISMLAGLCRTTGAKNGISSDCSAEYGDLLVAASYRLYLRGE
jgi:hypothetical protein